MEPPSNELLERNKRNVVAFYELIEEGRILEHWDVLQVVAAESKNGNTMF